MIRMSLELMTFSTVQEGLSALQGTAYTMAQNLKARHDSPILEDGKNIWFKPDLGLDSKTLQLYGGLNEDRNTRFKIDHDPDLASVLNNPISLDGSIPINKKIYDESGGTEFIGVLAVRLKGAYAHYAIRADKYQAVREQLDSIRTFDVNDFIKAGGFKVNGGLTPEEVENNDGWLELAVGKNGVSQQEYSEALVFLKSYLACAIERGSFRNNGQGMGFFADLGAGYNARPWSLNSSGSFQSHAFGWWNFSSKGYFLVEK